MRVSVIIPAYNEERLLGETLHQVNKAITAFNERGWETEIIVCDNNSTDGTADTARRGGASVVFEPVNQISRARNTGAAAAAGDWLVFIDADSHPDHALLAAVGAQIASGRCLAGGATVRMDCPQPGARWAVKTWNRVSRVCRWMAGSFIFCKTSAFREVGGFSQEVFVGEEIYLSRKLKRLARKRRKRIIILDGQSILTSNRKLYLYSTGDYLRFIFRVVVSFGGAKRNRAACGPWYDGRR